MESTHDFISTTETTLFTLKAQRLLMSETITNLENVKEKSITPKDVLAKLAAQMYILEEQHSKVMQMLDTTYNLAYKPPPRTVL